MNSKIGRLSTTWFDILDLLIISSGVSNLYRITRAASSPNKRAMSRTLANMVSRGLIIPLQEPYAHLERHQKRWRVTTAGIMEYKHSLRVIDEHNRST